MASRRERLIELLSLGRYSPKDLAKTVEMKVVDVLEDLEHVRKSVGKAFEVTPAACSSCDFVFEDRRKLSNPSRCPKCRAERIAGPWFHIDEDKLTRKSKDKAPNEEEGPLVRVEGEPDADS
jgi:hypothetical protein